MPKRNRPFPFGNLEPISIVVKDLRETVRLYEEVFGFVIEREPSDAEDESPGALLKKRLRRVGLLGKAPAGPGVRRVGCRVGAAISVALDKLRAQPATPAIPPATRKRNSRKPTPPRKRRVKQ